MKRIISALLTVAMLVTLITVPMMVTADAWSAPATITNSSDLFNDDLHTLYASYGTPTIDGTVEDAWANALTTRFDYSRMLITRPSKAKQSTLMDIYMMWDEDNLYILEERQFDTAKYLAGCTNFWGGDTCTCWLLSLPTPFTADTEKNDGASNMVCVHTGDPANGGLGYVARQDKWYKDNTGATNTVGYALFSEYSSTYTTLTETGFIMETAISWDALDNYTPGFEAAAGIEIGMMVYFKSAWQDNGNHCEDVGGSNAKGFQKIQLLADGAVNPTPASEAPDFSWFDPDEDTYYIYDAGDLLALQEISHMHGSSPMKAALGIENTNFTGKTIEIMADIDLNPGTTFNADGTYTGKTPVTGWYCLQDFKGTIDGNGHTISGLYLPNGAAYGQGNELRYVGLVGRGGAGLTIKDLSLTNGYLAVTSGTTNQTAASFLAVSHHYNGAGTITLANLYSDLYLKGAEFAGGIVGSTWFDNTLTWDVDNCVFTGTVGGTTNAGTLMGRDSAHESKNSGSIKNCYVPVDTKAIVTHKNSIALDGDAAYVQSTDVADGKINVRLLGLIDEAELDLDSVGMKVTVTYGADSKTKKLDNVTDVFATVNAAGEEIEISTLGADYAYGVVLKGVPAGAEDEVTIDVVLTRVINGVEVQSVCTYTATYVAGVLQ